MFKNCLFYSLIQLNIFDINISFYISIIYYIIYLYFDMIDLILFQLFFEIRALQIPII